MIAGVAPNVGVVFSMVWRGDFGLGGGCGPVGCVAVTQLSTPVLFHGLRSRLRSCLRFGLGVLSLAAVGGTASAQTPVDEDFHVYTDAPRLLLTKQRLRL